MPGQDAAVKTKDPKALIASLPSDREILMTRSFDAPRTLVFDAWTKPEHVRRWYGCGLLTFAECEIDLRVGGRWRYVLRDENGAQHVFAGVYREIERPARLVYAERYIGESFESPDALVAVRFEEEDSVTTLISRIRHESKEARDAHLASGVEDGAAETLSRLDALLAGVLN